LFLAVVEWTVRARGSPRGVLRVTALDVGQGDATLVDFPEGCALLVDGGGYVGSPVDPGKRVVLPVLRARRRSHLDVVVLSHPHPDHFGGLGVVLNGVGVGELWDTGEGERTGNPGYMALLATARERGVRIRRPGEICGIHPFCGASIEVLAPCPGPRETRSTNDNSFVIRIQHGQQSVLLVGDAEAAAEQELLAVYGSRLDSDLLKVGHHGSRTSSSLPFLEAVSPEVASVSCGMRNSYGHPHPEALERLSLGVPVLWRTDLSGSAIWESDGRKSTLHGFDMQPQGRFSGVSTP
jgi:competence protein ComEC